MLETTCNGLLWSSALCGGCTALVRDTPAFYIASMIGRPCRPDADVLWLWQTLLPNTPFSACGTANDQSAGIIDEEPGRQRLARE